MLTILHNDLHGLLVVCIQQEIDLLKVSLFVFFIVQILLYLLLTPHFCCSISTDLLPFEYLFYQNLYLLCMLY
jgi:hypothetical protein